MLSRINAIYRGFFLKSDVPAHILEERRRICDTCPWNSKNIAEPLSLINKMKKKLNKPFCTACGCFIQEKTKVASEACGLAEQEMEPKWEAVKSLSKTKLKAK